MTMPKETDIHLFDLIDYASAGFNGREEMSNTCILRTVSRARGYVEADGKASPLVHDLAIAVLVLLREKGKRELAEKGPRE